jgi:hypothetical protein
MGRKNAQRLQSVDDDPGTAMQGRHTRDTDEPLQNLTKDTGFLK